MRRDNSRVLRLSIAAAFVAGCGVTHVMRAALAAPDVITAQVIHTGELAGDAISSSSPRADAGENPAQTFNAMPNDLRLQRNYAPLHPPLPEEGEETSGSNSTCPLLR